VSKGTCARAFLVGRLGRDPEGRSVNNRQMVNMSLACTSGFGKHEATSWIPVVVFDEKKAKVLLDYAKKGSLICVTGEIRVRSYDKQGTTVWTTEVVVGFDGTIDLISTPKDEGGGAAPREEPSVSNNYGRDPKPAPGFGGGFDPDLDDDVPF
jgi:single-strand DNA-binding protein